MKKIILAVILLAAAGGAAYYLLQKKKQDNHITTINKELVIGKWKIDSLVSQKDSTKDGLELLLFAMDSNARREVYDFQTNGQVFVCCQMILYQKTILRHLHGEMIKNYYGKTIILTLLQNQ